MSNQQNRTNWTKIADKRCAKDKPITSYTDQDDNTFQIREHVYVDMGRNDQPSGIAFIHAFKERKDGLYMDVRWYYRFTDLPDEIRSNIIAEQHDKDDKSSLSGNNSTFKRIINRELFASETLDSCLACYIVGRCCIVSYRNLKEAQEFLPFPDTFYYLFTYNPHLRRVASTQGEIKIGDQFQAAIPQYEGEYTCKLKKMQTRNRKKVSLYPPSTEREEPAWCANVASKMSELDFVTFLQAVKSIAAFSSMCDRAASTATTNDAINYTQRDFVTQCAFDALHQSNYKFKDALEFISKLSLVSPVDKQWSDEDQKKFQRAIKQIGKNFYRIQRECLPDKTVPEVVEFYYSWKKTSQGLIMRPKRRLKPMLQRRSKNSNNANVVAITANKQNLQKESCVQLENVEFTSAVPIEETQKFQCFCCNNDKNEFEEILISKETNSYCADCADYFRRYGNFPSAESSVMELDEEALEGRLRDAMSPLLARIRVKHSHEESICNDVEKDVNVVDNVETIEELTDLVLPEEMSPDIVCSAIFSEKNNFRLVREWNRGNDNSCSRTDISYNRNTPPSPLEPRRSDKIIKRQNDSLHIKEEKRIKNESARVMDRIPSRNTASLAGVSLNSNFQMYNVPSLNKLYSPGNAQLLQSSPMFQHSFLPPTTCPIQISADTPALRQLRDIAAARSSCHFPSTSIVTTIPPNSAGIYSNSAVTALALQQFMAVLNSNHAPSSVNLQQQSLNSQLSPFFNPSLPSLNQREFLADQNKICNRRNSPASSREHLNASTHNHAHLHAHSHTHLHLNEANGNVPQPENQSPHAAITHSNSSCSAPPPLMMLPPGLQNSLYYQHLINHSAAGGSPSTSESEQIHNIYNSLISQGGMHNPASLELMQAMGYMPTQPSGFIAGNPYILPHSNPIGFNPGSLHPSFCPPISSAQNYFAAASQQHQHAMMMMRGISPEHNPHYQHALQQQLFLAAASMQRPSQLLQSPHFMNTRFMDVKPSGNEESPGRISSNENRRGGNSVNRTPSSPSRGRIGFSNSNNGSNPPVDERRQKSTDNENFGSSLDS